MRVGASGPDAGGVPKTAPPTPGAAQFSYPFTVATAIVSFIMIWIIPKFKAIFEGFDCKLPAITEWLITFSDYMAKYWYLIPTIPFGMWLFVKIVKKIRPAKAEAPAPAPETAT